MFRAHIVQHNDQIFTVNPSYGELLPEADDGTLFQVGFTPLTYGKNYQAQLIISVNKNIDNCNNDTTALKLPPNNITFCSDF
jgi:hypothetical protein